MEHGCCIGTANKVFSWVGWLILTAQDTNWFLAKHPHLLWLHSRSNSLKTYSQWNFPLRICLSIFLMFIGKILLLSMGTFNSENFALIITISNSYSAVVIGHS